MHKTLDEVILEIEKKRTLEKILSDVQKAIDALKNCKQSTEQDGEFCPDEKEF
jgi:hypothetical protein